jgi:hypothetical protein
MLAAGSQVVLPTVRFSPATTVRFTTAANIEPCRAYQVALRLGIAAPVLSARPPPFGLGLRVEPCLVRRSTAGAQVGRSSRSVIACPPKPRRGEGGSVVCQFEPVAHPGQVHKCIAGITQPPVVALSGCISDVCAPRLFGKEIGGCSIWHGGG